MKKGELDFFKATVLSKSMEDVFMCSDMPMEEFLDDSIALSTENIFYDKKIKYTYEDFIKHFELTIQYSNINKNYKVITNSYKTFKQNRKLQYFSNFLFCFNHKFKDKQKHDTTIDINYL